MTQIQVQQAKPIVSIKLTSLPGYCLQFLLLSADAIHKLVLPNTHYFSDQTSLLKRNVI